MATYLQSIRKKWLIRMSRDATELGQKPRSIGKVIIGINIKNISAQALLVTEMFFICKETAVSMTAALVLSLVYSGMVLG
jgi:hypothetical protein